MMLALCVTINMSFLVPSVAEKVKLHAVNVKGKIHSVIHVEEEGSSIVAHAMEMVKLHVLHAIKNLD